MGFSASHGSEIPLMINPLTGHISPQFHVVFNDSFGTVSSIQNVDEPPKFWNEFDLYMFLYQIPLDRDSEIVLEEEWLNLQDRGERERNQKGNK